MSEGTVLTVHIESDDFPVEHLHVRELKGREEISRLFQFDLLVYDIAKGSTGFVPAAVTSTPVSIVWKEHGREVRRIRGLVSAFREQLDTKVAYYIYRMRVVPRAFRLTLIETSEVFLDMSIPDIIKEKLSRVGLGTAEVEMRLTESYAPRLYVLQYKETDLAFISRLAEHAGIAFHFEDGGDAGDKIVFSDQQAAFPKCDRNLYGGTHTEKAQTWDLEVESRVIPAAYVVNDYDYDNPRLDLASAKEIQAGYGGGVVEHGPNYTSPDEGAFLSRIRAEGLDCRRVVYGGRSNLVLLGAGSAVELEDISTQHDRKILVTSIEHSILQSAGDLGAEANNVPYSNAFEAVRTETPFRPERTTPRPRISGLLVGFVTDYLAEGPYGAVDDTGQYTVRLHLDTAPHPSKQSLPIRMIQPHAGASYGTHMPLRPGTEVMVGFLAGDPDRPVIVGSVPNAITPSPVTTANNQINKILRTETGIVIEARDLYPPKADGKQQVPGF